MKNLKQLQAKHQEARRIAQEVLDNKFGELLSKFGLTVNQYLRYQLIQNKVYGHGLLKELFVVLDLENPTHKELNDLTPGVLQLHAHLVANRNQPLEKLFIQAFII